MSAPHAGVIDRAERRFHRLSAALCILMVVGLVGAATTGQLVASDIPGAAWIGNSLRALSIAIVCYGLGMATYMTYGSRIGRLRTRERLLDAIAWTGTEHGLDVGCGRGLMANR
jgi:hypothetical protein